LQIMAGKTELKRHNKTVGFKRLKVRQFAGIYYGFMQYAFQFYHNLSGKSEFK
jgi:hypothetical protein